MHRGVTVLFFRQLLQVAQDGFGVFVPGYLASIDTQVELTIRPDILDKTVYGLTEAQSLVQATTLR